ncbi:VOC family protein [Gottschalkiaceae bacterium SANA]|nr:VOC family protein [Gottschalkiaceae bacterium SANA]
MNYRKKEVINMFIPYLSFAGNCEEALNLYKDLFKGEIAYLQRFKDAPDLGTSPGYEEKIMHAQLQIGDAILYLSDTFEGGTVAEGSRVALNINFDSAEEQKRVYDVLKEGGVVEMELAETFWNSIYASVVDRFGIPWSLDYAKAQD